MRALEQVAGRPVRRLAPGEQDLAVLAVQRVAGRPGDHLADRPAQQRVAERERVVRDGHEGGVHRLLDRGQQRGRGLAEHLGRVIQPERRVQHRRRHQQVPGPPAQAVEPPLREAVHPPRQPGRGRHGAPAGDLYRVVVAQAADEPGHQRGVPRGAAGQVGQGLAGRRAERVGEHAPHRVLIQRGQGDPGGAVLLQQAEHVVGGALGEARPGQQPRDRVPVQLPWQRPQHGQRGRAGPVQVIQAHQDRPRPGPLFQVRAYLGDPPRRVIRQVTTGMFGGEPGERPAQRRAQREERDLQA